MGTLSNRKHVASRLASPCGWGDIEAIVLYRSRTTGRDSPGENEQKQYRHHLITHRHYHHHFAVGLTGSYILPSQPLLLEQLASPEEELQALPRRPPACLLSDANMIVFRFFVDIHCCLFVVNVCYGNQSVCHAVYVNVCAGFWIKEWTAFASL